MDLLPHKFVDCLDGSTIIRPIFDFFKQRILFLVENRLIFFLQHDVINVLGHLTKFL